MEAAGNWLQYIRLGWSCTKAYIFRFKMATLNEEIQKLLFRMGVVSSDSCLVLVLHFFFCICWLL